MWRQRGKPSSSRRLTTYRNTIHDIAIRSYAILRGMQPHLGHPGCLDLADNPLPLPLRCRPTFSPSFIRFAHADCSFQATSIGDLIFKRKIPLVKRLRGALGVRPHRPGASWNQYLDPAPSSSSRITMLNPKDSPDFTPRSASGRRSSQRVILADWSRTTA